MSILKKQGAGAYASLLTIILAAVAMVLYSLNGATAYYNDTNQTVLLLTGIAIATEALLLVLARVLGEKRWLDIAYLAVPVLLAVALTTFIGARVESAGIILGSDLESGNAEAYNALIQAFWGIGVYLAAIVASMAGSFMKQLKT